MIILAASKSTDGNGAEAATDRRKGEQLRAIFLDVIPSMEGVVVVVVKQWEWQKKACP